MQLNSLTLEKMGESFIELGFEKYRAKQCFKAIHNENKFSIDDIKQLKVEHRSILKEKYTFAKPKIFKKYVSTIDGTTKYLIRLDDDNIIETVVMKYEHGFSQCISTQVGCKMGCSFCASTKEGLIRNLTPAELVSQIYLTELDLGIRISNIVLMGSGEPLDNYENVIDFFKIINSSLGRNISLRSITLSTCGITNGIRALSNEGLPITLSISLHSPFDSERQKIMPIAKTNSISELIDSLEYYFRATKRRITLEYTLIEGINDRDIDALELSRIISNNSMHINLIPLNSILEYNEKKPSKKGVLSFKSKLEKLGLSVTIRREMGSDISASCGQLKRSTVK